MQKLAAEINEILFSPKLQTPIKTLDIPIAGKVYSFQALPLVLDFVNIANNGKINDKDDDTGETTIQTLKNARKVAYRLNSNNSSSLGLHPSVYFYSTEGRHKAASFFAMVDFVMTLDKQGKINDFIFSRAKFEKFILEYDYLTQQINRKYRTVQHSYKHISMFFQKIITLFKAGKAINETINEIISGSDFNYLALQKISDEVDTHNKDFNTGKKSEIFTKEALKGIPKCGICEGFIHRNSISIDHIKRKQDGGLGNFYNGQLSHPYCNTGYKN